MIEILVPRENVNDESVIILQVNFASGEFVKKGDVVVSIETSKTNIDVESPDDGIISHQLEKGLEINVGSILFSVIDFQGEASIKGRVLSNEINSIDTISRADSKFSNAAIKRAKELGVNLDNLDKGWITSEAVEKHAGLSIPKSVFRQHDSLNSGALNTKVPMLTVPATKINITKRKQIEAKSLLIGEHGSTTSTIGIEISLLGRRLISPPFLFKEGISDLVAFEASKLLQKYPELNSAFNDEKSYSQYDQINFGWSFDDGKNLKVLAIKDANLLTLEGIQKEVARLLDLYESGGSIPMELLIDSTVTFSDLSRSQASFMLPLINGYQSLILGVVRKSKYVFELFASFDHRISEGLSVANFLGELRTRILSHYRDKNGVINLFCYTCGKSMIEELSLGHRGFVKMTLANGEDENLCRNCFEGF